MLKDRACELQGKEGIGHNSGNRVCGGAERGIGQNGAQNYDSISGDSSLRGGICIGLLHMLVLRKAIEQNGAQNDAEMSADEIAKRYLCDGKTVETEFVDDTKN